MRTPLGLIFEIIYHAKEPHNINEKNKEKYTEVYNFEVCSGII